MAVFYDPSNPTPNSRLWPDACQHPLILESLHKLNDRPTHVAWEPLFPLVDVHWLYRDSTEGPAAALIRFQPGGRVPLHEHRGFEHIFVLTGSQTDEHGRLRTGSLMVHAPGTRHSVISEDGCLVLAI